MPDSKRPKGQRVTGDMLDAGPRVSVEINPAALSDEQLAAIMKEAGHRSAARRKRTTLACRACGAVMENVLATRRYCSGACRNRACYWRYKDPLEDPTAPFRLRLEGKGWQDARTYTRKPPKKGKRA